MALAAHSAAGAAVDPAALYAWYRGDAGLLTNAAGLVTAWRNQAASGAPSSRHLDRISGTPQSIPCESAGGIRAFVRFDGADGVWGASSSFGTISTSRTLIAYCRLAGTNDGFLFDGSANAPGLTRAQVRGGSWQAGLQPSGSGSKADTNTLAAAAGDWQAHVFVFERLADSTRVTHAVGGGGRFTYVHPLVSGMGGLILGQNVAASLGLGVDLAEFMVCDRALAEAEWQGAIDYLAARWGSPAEIAPPPCAASQAQRVVPAFGLHALLQAQVLAPADPNGLAVTNLAFTLEGTTDVEDVARVRIYWTGTSSEFRPLALFGADEGPFTGPRSIPGYQALDPGVNHFWIAVEPRRAARWGRRLDATLEAVGTTGGVRVPPVAAPPEFLLLGNTYAATVLRKRGDEGVHTYRIPGIATSARGTVIAVFDIRYDGGGDLPGNVDVGVLRSVDGGNTWGPMIKALDFDKGVPGSSGNGVGDPAILADRETGTIWVAGLWSYGSRAYAGSGAGLSTNQTGQYVLARSDDDGLTWSAPINITPQAKVNPQWGVCFQGPGHGIQLRDGTLLFPSQHTDPGGVNARAFFIYSTNHGASWLASPDVNPSIPPQLNENQMAELNSGQIMVSSRAPSGGGGKRVWATYTPGSTTGSGSWSPLVYSLPDPVCQASFLRYSSTLDGAPRNRLLFANPASSSSRHRMTVRMSEDEGLTWTVSRQVDDRPAAYSDMAVLPDGTVGLLYETGGADAYETLTLVRFDLDWLTQADLDSDGDGMSDYYEGINGLNAGADDAGMDLDSDGASNLVESKAGTMANDVASVFRIESFSSRSDGLSLGWASVPGIGYAIEGAPDLSGQWSLEPDAGDLYAPGGLRSFLLPRPVAPQRFFRVVVRASR
ncbi:MAG TPA: exo-alpha-sialidase [Candidatus Paceibacterota bacterium]|nr:exo-alpha-sialidase [Candidatus Paceibacterota bacterium]HRZ91731.1 exo-alpha-sialidase [Candidatus Paceibacterota bacterium]